MTMHQTLLVTFDHEVNCEDGSLSIVHSSCKGTLLTTDLIHSFIFWSLLLLFPAFWSADALRLKTWDLVWRGSAAFLRHKLNRTAK